MILLFTAHFIYLTWTIFCPRNVYFIIIAIHRLIMTVIYQHYFWRYFKIVNTSQFWQLFPYKIKHLEFHNKYNSSCSIIHGSSHNSPRLVTGPCDGSQAASEDSFVVAILSQLVTSIYNLDQVRSLTNLPTFPPTQSGKARIFCPPGRLF